MTVIPHVTSSNCFHLVLGRDAYQVFPFCLFLLSHTLSPLENIAHQWRIRLVRVYGQGPGGAGAAAAVRFLAGSASLGGAGFPGLASAGLVRTLSPDGP